MKITLFGLKNCDTCKKALKALDGQDVTFVDIRSEADLGAKVPAWLAVAGADTLVNKRSTTWRNLSEEERNAASGHGAASLLEKNPTLIKRPVIEAEGRIFVGWSADVKTALGV